MDIRATPIADVLVNTNDKFNYPDKKTIDKEVIQNQFNREI